MENLNLSKQDIIKRIKFLRKKKNISAYKLGLELGHSKTYFYRIENGEIQLTVDSFIEILEILEVSTSEFFCPSLKSEDIKILDKISNLDEENKNFIMSLINKIK